jgi:hypothetical protein
MNDKSVSIYIALGRWSGQSPIMVEGLQEEVLCLEIKKFLANLPDANSLATQVLIWCDSGRIHNLIGLYDIYSKRLICF